MERCIAIRQNGEQCKCSPMQGEQYCFFHHPDPEIKKRKAEAISKGGRTKVSKHLPTIPKIKIKSPQDVCRILARTINGVKDGNVSPKDANAIGYLSGQLIKAFEVSQRYGKPPDMGGGKDDSRPMLTDKELLEGIAKELRIEDEVEVVNG